MSAAVYDALWLVAKNGPVYCQISEGFGAIDPGF